ncbi:Dopey, N-terminal-domain-containing protein [Kickxella alabastrina]|uniref:Dopey, N-terminal-domain-containing protein n=1 Tax=Kickxella alabastrina TaxID=61397 RepID=UPI00221EE186|nr:Dopey, N-terminal-domain-containing protein [Kickxella alabastrina]KAI7822798.1 Dopey, N-terminal-domain-containing protein [Kickxella alabastrina]
MSNSAPSREAKSPSPSPSLLSEDHDATAANSKGIAKASKTTARINIPATLSFETDLSLPRRKQFEDRTVAYKGDPKYQGYVQLIDRNLQSFENVRDWADITAFLTKLTHSFTIYPQFAVVPHKETVAKRLAQSLNPALPTGVHQKALSIYEQIARQIGSDQLAADLSLYAYGLFPFMRNSSLMTKSQLLDIFEEFFIPLGSSLRPCMKSFIVGVLPGLEEGTVEIFNRVMQLLDKLRDTVDAAFFFETMFLVMITNAEQRESALKYLAQRLPVFTKKEDIAPVCGEDSSLMARALAATLTDSKTLVLRAALDLLMTRFPLRTNIFDSRDLVLLLKHAAEVVLKKDMSLNRRLYTWLLGPNETDAEQAAYFVQFAQKPLTEALLGSFAAMSSDPEHQHMVLRVLIGLIDKPVISQPILDALFVPLLQLLIAERGNRQSERALPVKLASVSRMLVEMLDPIFTWSNVINQLTDSVSADSGDLDVDRIARALRLVLFFVQTFELDDEATLQVHIPMAMLTILATLDRILKQNRVQASISLGCCFTRLAIEMFARIPKSVFVGDTGDDGHDNGNDEVEVSADGSAAGIVGSLNIDTLFDTTRSFYRVHRSESIDSNHSKSVDEVERSAAKVVRGSGLLYAIIRLCKNIAAGLGLHIVSQTTSDDATADSERLAVVAMEDICHILQTATAYSQDFMHLPELAQCTMPLPELSPAGQQPVHADLWVPTFVSVICHSREFSAIKVTLGTLLQFVERKSLARSVLLEHNSLTKFVKRLWDTLSPETTTCHFQATQLLYQLRSRIDARTVERLLAGRLAEFNGNYARELARYSVFWNNMRLIQREAQFSTNDTYDPLVFSRLLLLVLDGTMLSDDWATAGIDADCAGGDGDNVISALSRQMASQAWIDSSVGEWEYIAQTLLTLLLLSIRTHKRKYSAVLAVGYASECQEYTAEFDYARITYYIDTIQRYLKYAGDDVIRSMSALPPTNAAILDACESFTASGDSWLQVLVSTAIEFALTDAPTNASNNASSVEIMRAKAVSLAVQLVSQYQVSWPTAYIAKLQTRVVDALLFCVLHRHIPIQPPLLDLFGSLVRANVSSSSDVSAATALAAKGKGTRAAGIGAISDLNLFSRLVLAALTMQLSTVALSKWVKTIRLCLPYIQDYISATTRNFSTEDQDLMRILALPCLHALRLLLSQCSEYFARSNDLHVKSRRRTTRHQLRQRLIPLFAIPSDSMDKVDNDSGMSIHVLSILLDAFDLFLTLCLRNPDRLISAEAVTTAMNRPSSRASDISVQSSALTTAVAMTTAGALGPIPILKFVSGIFGQDESADVIADPAVATNPGVSSEESGNANLGETTESTGFSLVTVLAVIRELWNAFDPTLPRKAGHDSPDALLLREFGVSNLHIGEHSGEHMKRTVHTHIQRIIEHAVSAQPAEMTEAMAALWINDNPQWITHLEATVRQGSAQQRSRRRQSSASSMHSTFSPASAPRELALVTAMVVLEEEPVEAIEWNWRAADLLESVPGRSPITILTTLLNDLHIRSIDPATSVAQSASSGAASQVGLSDNRGNMRFSALDDIALTRFIELYTRHRLVARSSSALVPHVIPLLRDYNTYAQQHKFMLPFLLRMFTELCERVASSSLSQDPSHRVYSNELCAIYARLVDNCILIAGRSFDQTTWLRRAQSDAVGGLIIRNDSAPGMSDRVLSEDHLIDQMLSYISGCVVPQFALLVPDYERQVSIANNLMHYAVLPAFKSHMTGGYSGPAQASTSRSQHFALVLRCLGALSQQPSLMKVWKREVWEFFCDSKFFPGSVSPDHTTMTPALAPLWRHLVRTLLLSEKEKFDELLDKISSAAPGPALFANREHEAHMLAIALRRLSFVIWAGSVNQYLSLLPHVQKSLVDTMKNNPHPVVQMEVFLCLRVMLCRISSHHMSNFWPMLLTELMRLCTQQLNREGREDPEQANLFLAACKFLDLLFILGTDDFLVHQWIFITDTIDALYGSRSVSYALLDRLSSRLLSMPSSNAGRRVSRPGDQMNFGALASNLDSDTYPKVLFSDSDDPTNLVYQQVSPAAAELTKSGIIDLASDADLQTLSGRPLKRPIIRVRSVTSIRELDAFVHNASVQTYQAAYTMAEPDVEFIEALLVSDLMYMDFAGTSMTTAAAPSTPTGAFTGDYEF